MAIILYTANIYPAPLFSSPGHILEDPDETTGAVTLSQLKNIYSYIKAALTPNHYS